MLKLLNLVTLVVLVGLPTAQARAQIADPIPGSIPVSEEFALVDFVAELPSSGPANRPIARPMTLVGDGTGRRFVADQNGIVYQLHADDSLSVFLDVAAATDLVTTRSQQGLTSIAFHPDYFVAGSDGEGRFYTASSQAQGSSTPDFPVPAGAPYSHDEVLHEWIVSADPNAIDPSSAREVLRIGEPYNDHNLGQVSFNPYVSPGHPDYGLLFVAVGDGGNVCCPRPTIDPWLVGQDRSQPLGKMLRIDPLESDEGAAAYSSPADNPFALDGDPNTLAEIWAYGLRNPHRFSWDAADPARMYISDIGQANIEEINLGQSGANYGWSEREGTFLVVHENERDVFELPPDDALRGFSYPVIQYDHDEDDRAVSGGYVFRRGSSDLEGEYLFGDLASGRIFHAPASELVNGVQIAFSALRLVDGGDGQERSLLEIIGDGVPAPRADLRFGRDDDGRIYLLTKRDGSIRMLSPLPRAIPTPGLSLWGALGLTLAAVLSGGATQRASGPVREPPRVCRSLWGTPTST